MKYNSKVLNLGCRLNYFESEMIKGILEKNKINKKIVINTCAVTNEAVKKSISEVKKASIKFPDHQIIVTGCASQIEKDVFADLSNVSRIIDNKLKTQENLYLDLEHTNGEEEVEEFPFIKNTSSSRSRAMLQIQQGCDHRCTFCIIPFGRGDAKSLPFNEINKRAEYIIKQGFNEMVITGVDLTSYGNDLKGMPRLGNVIKRLLSSQPELQRLRLSSIDPAEIDQDLFKLFCSEERLMPHIHLSLQSGDDLILKRMKRRHSRKQVIELCRSLKSFRPELTFGADIIVGFPTETDKQFSNTLDLVETINFSNVHVFPYSPKKGTPASRMPQVDEEKRKERATILRQTSKRILHSHLNRKIGKSATILFESTKNSYTNEYFKVKLTKFKGKFPPESGEILNVKLLQRQNEALIAEIKQ
ncbi:MAG: tRNA (N(6)-L-threonylcarbamoyladenosine(37)-C(2))-methylthiotransferase MtaB [Alphaproteobacteria bacterium]